MSAPTLFNAPATEPIALADAKLHLRIESDETADDALVTALIAAARQQAEHETGCRLVTQTWKWTLDAFPSGEESIRLHASLWPVQSVSAIQYVDSTSVLRTMNSALYSLDAVNAPGYVFLAAGAAWPSDVADSANAVTLTVVSGYGAAADVPHAIRQWMLLQIGAMYRNREAFSEQRNVAELPNRFVDRLLDPFRVVGV